MAKNPASPVERTQKQHPFRIKMLQVKQTMKKETVRMDSPAGTKGFSFAFRINLD